MTVWTASFGRIMRSSVWTLSAALPTWSAYGSEASSLLPGILSSCQSSILGVWLILLSTSKLCPNPACVSKFMSLPPLFFFLLVWLYHFISFWNLLLFAFRYNTHHLPYPWKVWDIIAILIYVLITSQWQIPNFKFSHLLLILFCHGAFAMVFNALCSTGHCPLPVHCFDLVYFFNCSTLNYLLHTFLIWVFSAPCIQIACTEINSI